MRRLLKESWGKREASRAGFLFLGTFLFFTAEFGSANTVEVWSRLYKQGDNMSYKEAAIRSMVLTDDPRVAPVLVDALIEMNGLQQNYLSNSYLRTQWASIATILVRALGKYKANEAQDALWFVVVNPAMNSVLRADALMALGDIRARAYAPQIAMVLRNLNFNSQPENTDGAEIEAYGAVYALQRLQEPVGFEPTFYAATGWYSKRTRDFAMASLPALLQDPSDELIRIMKAGDYSFKLAPLKVGLRLLSTPEAKNKLALAALQEGLFYRPTDKVNQDRLSKLRQNAIVAMIDNRIKDEEAVPFLADAVKRDFNSTEVLYAYKALGYLGNQEAVDFLIERLNYYSNRQASGIAMGHSQLSYVKQIIHAMGLAGDPRAIMALTVVEFSDFTPSIIRLAQETAKSL